MHFFWFLEHFSSCHCHCKCVSECHRTSRNRSAFWLLESKYQHISDFILYYKAHAAIILNKLLYSIWYFKNCSMKAVLWFEFLVKGMLLQQTFFIFFKCWSQIQCTHRGCAVVFKIAFIFQYVNYLFIFPVIYWACCTKAFFLLSSLGWWQILIIWLSFTTITLTKMSYIPFIGIESGNLSKLVKGKFLEMFLNIIIKNWLNQYRKKYEYLGVWRKPLTHCSFDVPAIASG